MTADAASDPLEAVRLAAAAISAHERAGSDEALRRAEADLDAAINSAVSAGHDADEIAEAGTPELVLERVQQTIEGHPGGGLGRE